jgi:hypothetical protein
LGIERLILVGAEAMELQALRPGASREARADGARVLRFRGAAPKQVEIEVVPRGLGWSRGRLQLAGGEELAFEQLVLP